MAGSFCFALSLAFWKLGIAIEDRIPIIATTTINSTESKCRIRVGFFWLLNTV